MPNGTTLNGVFCPRIHKHNAADVLEGATEALQHATRHLLMLSALSPASDMESVTELQREVIDCVEEIERATWEMFCAQYIIDYPDEVEDGLEEAQ